jgi:hypothetical protein
MCWPSSMSTLMSSPRCGRRRPCGKFRPLKRDGRSAEAGRRNDRRRPRLADCLGVMGSPPGWRKTGHRCTRQSIAVCAGVSVRLSPRPTAVQTRQARFFAKLAVTLALSEALNYADLAADRERLLAHGTNGHRELHRLREARGIVLERLEWSAAARQRNATKPNPSLQVIASGSHTDGTVRERTNYTPA